MEESKKNGYYNQQDQLFSTQDRFRILKVIEDTRKGTQS